MTQPLPLDPPVRSGRFAKIVSNIRVQTPNSIELLAALGTAILLTVSFPNFNLWFLGWIALIPLLLVIARRPAPLRAFLLGWITGSVFFYASCYWLTYSMIHYGGLPAWVAYLLLVPGALVVGLFPGLFAVTVAMAIQRWGSSALLLAPIVWPATEWLRLQVTGQLWNALGYSQALSLQGLLIAPASWGGVYAISFLLIALNVAVLYLAINRTLKSLAIFLLIVWFVGATIGGAVYSRRPERSYYPGEVDVIAIQPNVPMTLVKSVEELNQLFELHLSLSVQALKELPANETPRLVVWPESPMNFTYATDPKLRDRLAKFTREHHTSLLLNSLQPAPGEGFYNSAVLINEEGLQIAQYDKIRLMPFGEYVPLPAWLPGASLITGMVGDFTPGSQYTLMPVGNLKVGVFICIESAYPWVARRLTSEGADVLINISNDGYLGPTAVMQQHLANVVVRAVENGRPLLRVANTGLSADILFNGLIEDQTTGFQVEVRKWGLSKQSSDTFYTRYGDVFVYVCVLLTMGIFAITLFSRNRSIREER
jgi:apolipoprotein N-acyltransferase